MGVNDLRFNDNGYYCPRTRFKFKSVIMRRPKTMLVIGAGVVGAACALRLQTAGVAVTLIDPGDAQRGASFGNAGHLAIEQVSPWASWDNLLSFPSRLFGLGGALDFRWRDIGLWGPWSLRFIAACNAGGFRRGQAALGALLGEAVPAWERLAALAGRAEIVKRNGHHVLWMTEQGAARGMRAWRDASIGGASFREMSAPELARIGEMLAHTPRAGIAFTGTGQLSEPQAARAALLEAFASAGGKIIIGRVARLSARAEALLDDGDVVGADAALACAGAWSGALMRGLGVNAPLIGERGYSVESDAPGWPEDLPPLVFEERSMIVSRFGSSLRASSHLEFGAPDAPADPRKWRRLQMHLRQLGIAFAKQPRRWVGPRPTLPDYLPAIGRLRDAPNIFYAFGHQHLGVTLAAISAELMEIMVTTDAAGPHALRIERFASRRV
jgi:D-hydroxyproline dehydrogenase